MTIQMKSVTCDVASINIHNIKSTTKMTTNGITCRQRTHLIMLFQVVNNTSFGYVLSFSKVKLKRPAMA
jgi:hypothetical protein